MVLREQDKHFLSSLYSAAAIIFVWKGLWEGLYDVPYIGDAFVALFVGFTMLLFSGLIFKEFDPLGGIQKAVNKTLHSINTHHDKKNFQFKYYDKEQKKYMVIPATWVKKIEKGALVAVRPHQKQETFIPVHRVTEVLYKGKSYWRL